MGQLGDPTNTFWQLLHAAPGSSQWSSVTPQGVADNGGIVVAPGVATDSVAVGFLPSQLLRFSPLSVSTNSGHTWSPAFLPGALTSSPNALATGPDGSLALVATKLLSQSSIDSAWAPIAGLTSFRELSTRCNATALDAVALEPTGAAVVGAACQHGGVGLFFETDGIWHRVPGAQTLPGDWRNAHTSVLRLQSGGSQISGLIEADQAGRRALFAVSESATSALSVSRPLSLNARSTVRATAIDPTGALSVLIGSKRSPSAEEINPGTNWKTLPTPPVGTLGLAWVTPGSLSFGGLSLDAFTVVGGTELHVYALTPARVEWAPVQTLQVPLAYGSSG